MESPNKILGFIQFKGSQHPFFYSNKVLHMLPSNTEEWHGKRQQLIKHLDELNNQTTNREWLEIQYLTGITFQERGIIFQTIGQPESNFGFEEIKVAAFYEYSLSSENNRLINGLIIESNETEYFYNATNRLNIRGRLYSDDELDSSTVSLGYYVHKNISINLFLIIFPRSVNSPVYGSIKKYRTALRIELDQAVNFELCLEIIQHYRCFLKYICYRSNIDFNSIATFDKNSGAKEGSIFILNDVEIESHKSREVQLITYDLLQDKTINLIEAIASSKVYFHHICISIQDTKKYNIARAILIFCAFEKEFAFFFPSENLRSEGYLTTKEKVISSLEEIKAQYNSKQKSYISRFIKLIRNSDNNLEFKIKKALVFHIDNIGYFLRYYYESDNNDTIDGIAERMSEMRNDFAHGNLSIEIKPIHIDDLNVIEIVVYIMRLHNLGLEVNYIRTAICQLYGISA